MNWLEVVLDVLAPWSGTDPQAAHTEDSQMPLCRPKPRWHLPIGALILALALLAPAVPASDLIRINGAGASFPAPLYLRWFRDYYQAHPNVLVDYQAIGSGAGIANLIQGRFDFAGSDEPLTETTVEQLGEEWAQIPMVAGAIVMAYHLPGIDELKLSREALAAIFLGEATRWNDPLISAANPGVALPDLPIVVVARVDSSGTSLLVTRHLSAISETFADHVGSALKPVWPKVLQDRGGLIRGNGNGGVARLVQAVPGAIGYVQYAYAHLSGIPMASLQNETGAFVPPNETSFQATLASFRAELDLSDLADPKGTESYPILALSWLIVPRPADDAKGQALRQVLRYALTEGQKDAAPLGYIPLSPAAVEQIMERLGLPRPIPSDS